jgi:hypothetical protein
VARIDEEMLIDAEPGVVFRYRLDFAGTLQQYNPNVSRVVQTGGDGPGQGSRYAVTVRMGPGFTVTSEITVTEVDEPALIADHASSSAGAAQERLTFQAVPGRHGGTATKVNFAVETQPEGIVARLFDPLMGRLSRRQVRTELRLMREQLESQQAGR